MVLQNAYKLKGSSFGISEQYPAEINNRRKNLYPIMREAKQQRRHVVLVRDRLFIDGEQYIPPEDRPANTTSLLTLLNENVIDSSTTTGSSSTIILKSRILSDFEKCLFIFVCIKP
jgi:hypothetical protein